MTDKRPQSAVGIDLGTTYSVVAHIDAEGRPWTILNSEGDLTTPSVVYFDNEEVVVGKEAVKVAEYEPDHIAQFVKRDMGNRAFHKTICGRQLPPEVIQSLILKKLKADAELKLGPLTQAVITVPAYFNEPRRKATQDAGRLAGLDVLDIINEPTAAAIAYGVQHGFLNAQGESERKETVLVYDLGGGTFDVTLMEIDGRNYTALATAGDVYLGGIDWDHRIVNFIADAFLKEHGVDLRKDECALQTLLHEAEDAKRALTAREEVKIHFAHEGQRLRLTLSREEFESLTGDLLDRTLFTIQKLLREAHRAWSDVTRLLLVGGSSRMPMIQRMLEQESGLPVDRSLSPDEAVAHGAAVYAGMLASEVDPEEQRIRLTNVNSHDLGVLGVERATGLKRRQIMIPRNTPLPANATHVFTTYQDNQPSVVVNVIEGGDASGNNSTPIGKCVVADLPKGLPAKTPVEVRFHYRADGRFTVKAKLPTVGHKAEMTIERASGLSNRKMTEWAGRIEQGVSSTALLAESDVPSEEDEPPGPCETEAEGSLPDEETVTKPADIAATSTPSPVQDEQAPTTVEAVPSRPFFVKQRETRPATDAVPETSPDESATQPLEEDSAVQAADEQPVNLDEQMEALPEPFAEVTEASDLDELTSAGSGTTAEAHTEQEVDVEPVEPAGETTAEAEAPSEPATSQQENAAESAEPRHDESSGEMAEVSREDRAELPEEEVSASENQADPVDQLQQDTAEDQSEPAECAESDTQAEEESADVVMEQVSADAAAPADFMSETENASEEETDSEDADDVSAQIEESRDEEPAGVAAFRRLSIAELNEKFEREHSRRQRQRTMGALAMTTIMHALVFVALALIILPARTKDVFATITSQMTTTEQEVIEETLEVEVEAAETVNLQAGSVSTTAVGGSNSSVVSQQKIEQSSTLKDPEVQVNLSQVEVPGMEVLGQDLGEGEVTGEVGAVVQGYGEALDRITQELVRMLRTHRLLVVWLFDESGSMKDDQEDIKNRISTVYEELNLEAIDKVTFGQLRGDKSDHLLTAITSFGGEFHIETPKPTSDLPTIMKAIEAIPVDKSGAEATYQSLITAIEQYKKYRSGQSRKIVFIVVSDESGDDGELVDEVMYRAVSIKSPIYFMGREAVFGSLFAHIRWIQPQTGRLFLLPIRRGPETPYAEQLQFDGFHKRHDAQMSGFGPYEQVRLARKTGGIFFQLPREEQDINDVTILEEKEKMLENREYIPSTVARREYAGERDKSRFRKAIWDVIVVLNPYDKNASELFVPTDGWFVKEREGFTKPVNERLDQIMAVLRLLREAQQYLDSVANLRDQEPSVRWRANYDLIRAQIFAYQVRLFEYGIGLSQFADGAATGTMFKDPKSNRWRVGHGTQQLILPNDVQEQLLKVTAAELVEAQKKAVSGFEKVIHEHPNTPWAMRAQWEMERGFGVSFVEAFHDNVPRPPPPKRTPPPEPPKL